jgi:hypothetical protein
MGFWSEETKSVRKCTSMLSAEMPLGLILVTVEERGRACGDLIGSASDLGKRSWCRR